MPVARVRLRTKLLLLSATGYVSIALIGGTAYLGLRSAATTESFLAEDAVPSLSLASALDDETSHVRESQLKLVILKTPEELTAITKEFDAAKDRIGKLVAEYEKTVDNDPERRLFEAVVTAHRAHQATIVATLATAKAGDASQLDALQQSARVEGGKVYEVLDTAVNNLVEYNVQAVRDAHVHAVAANHNAVVWVVGIALAAALAIGLFASWLTRGLLRQFGGEPGDAAALAQAVAGGDLSRPIVVAAGDSSSVMASLKAMQQSLVRTVADVRRNAEGVATASVQIAQGNNDLSSRTEAQASALQQTAASMEQLGGAVKQNADNARQANQLAQSASAVAVQGGAVVGDVVDTMKAIDQSSKRIVDIIGVIDGIAFQTNILALNAAVEAARAGEQGRGFAVVATEVRSLAQRSADAAKEIKSLIASSVERVEQGTALVGRAGSTMQEVVASIRRVTDIMGEISAANTEQSAGVSQVGEAVSQMDRATQQNAALVEESAAAAESLKSQASQLVQAVAVFTLDATDGHPGHADGKRLHASNAALATA